MKPLLFCTRSIIAWQRSAKTQTRRLVKPQPEGMLGKETGQAHGIEPRWYAISQDSRRLSITLFEPSPKPYAVGDLLWIREGLERSCHPMDDGSFTLYQADCKPVCRDAMGTDWPWKRDKVPAMFMPKWACRYYARVVSVRPERLQDISDEDAVAEGTLVAAQDWPPETTWYDGRSRWLYLCWWDSLHKKPGTRSEDNPWLWVYGLEKADDRSE